MSARTRLENKQLRANYERLKKRQHDTRRELRDWLKKFKFMLQVEVEPSDIEKDEMVATLIRICEIADVPIESVIPKHVALAATDREGDE